MSARQYLTILGTVRILTCYTLHDLQVSSHLDQPPQGDFQGCRRQYYR